MPVFRLDTDSIWFPTPRLGEPDGLVAVGGDLGTERLLLAYANGFFPWYSFRDCDEPLWYCPMDRFVIFPADIHISHSMRLLIKQHRFRVSLGTAFDRVVEGCATANHRDTLDGAWLGPDIVEAYTRLHRLGFATSVEVWDGDRLVGGLYGVVLKRAFFGESMFSLVPNASKLALIALAQRLAQLGWHFIDCQFETPHLRTMGGSHIPYARYMALLDGQ